MLSWPADRDRLLGKPLQQVGRLRSGYWPCFSWPRKMCLSDERRRDIVSKCDEAPSWIAGQFVLALGIIDALPGSSQMSFFFFSALKMPNCTVTAVVPANVVLSIWTRNCWLIEVERLVENGKVKKTGQVAPGNRKIVWCNCSGSKRPPTKGAFRFVIKTQDNCGWKLSVRLRRSEAQPREQGAAA